MSSHELMRRLALAAPLAVFAAVPAAAQQADPPAEVQHRNECRRAVQVLAPGGPESELEREWARLHLGSCTEEAPAFLAAEWARVRGDTARVKRLIYDSGRMRDERLYQVLQTVVSDRSRPELVRVGAMLVLVRYVDPYNEIGFEELRPPVGEVGHIRLVLTSNIHGNQRQGARPLGSVGAPVLGLLRRVASRRDDEPRAVWYAAEILAKRVWRDIDAGRAR